MADLVWSKAVVLLVSPTSLSLHQILYVSRFSVHLLFISAITRALPCTVTFFPFHCIFHDLYTGWRIGLCRENGRGIYELVTDEHSWGPQALFFYIYCYFLYFVASPFRPSIFWQT